MNERERAFRILRKETDRAIDTAADSRDDAFVRTIVQGVRRWRILLDHVATVLSGRPADRIDPDAIEILRIGLYQIYFMDVADHAAVSETVEVAKRHQKRAAGFVNAILRKATRSELSQLLPERGDLESVALRYAHPSWLVEKWGRTFGHERAEAIARANQELSRADALVNTSLTDLSDLERRLTERGVSYKSSELATNVIRLEGSSQEIREEVDSGLLYLMDEGSVVIARLAARAGERILDLTAAPGGKSIALRVEGSAVVSADLSIDRIHHLPALWNGLFDESPRIIVGDARRPPFRGSFDVVLLDAPCSATGIIRKHPEIRHRLRPDRLASYAERQRQLLAGALSVDSRFWIYSTCSLEPEENDEVVRDVLRARSDLAIGDLSEFAEPAIQPWIQRGILRLTPESGADGFTAILLKKME